MSPLTDVTSGVAPDGKQYLSFTAAIGNVGPGPFIVHAVRGDQRGSWRVSQRFRERDAPTSEVVTPGTMVFGGHGHDHWHVQLGASYWLTRTGSNEVLRRYSKVGYCFFDQVRLRVQPADAPRDPDVRQGHVQRPQDARARDGPLSRLDRPVLLDAPRPAAPRDGLADGVYRLWADADPSDWFRETNETNNRTWVDLRLTLSTDPPRATVVRVGRPARRLASGSTATQRRSSSGSPAHRRATGHAGGRRPPTRPRAPRPLRAAPAPRGRCP